VSRLIRQSLGTIRDTLARQGVGGSDMELTARP
jgi:hypothetical protein